MIIQTGARFIVASCIYGGAEVAARGVQFVCLFMLARNSSKAEYGALGLLFAVQQLFTMLTLAGVTEVMTGRSAEFRQSGQLGSLFANSHRLLLKKISILIGFACLAAGALLFFNAEHLSPATFFCCCISGMLLGKSRLIGSMYQLKQRHAMAVVFQTLPLLICYSVGLASALIWSNPVDGLFIGGCGGLLLWTLVSSPIQLPSSGLISLDMGLQQRLFTDSLSFAAIAFLGWLAGYGNSIAVGGLLDVRAVADYTMTLHFDGIVAILLSSIASVWFPRFYQMAAEEPPERLNAANSLAFLVHSLVGAVASGVLLILFPLVPRLLQGNFSGYSHLGTYMTAVFAAQIILTGYYRSHAYYLLHRRGPQFFRILLATSALGFGAWYGLMMVLGAPGIYVGVVVMAALRSAGTHFYAQRQWGLPAWELDAMFGLAILGCAYGMTMTSLAIWMQLLTFCALAIAMLAASFFSLMANRLRVLNRSRTVSVSAESAGARAA